MKNTNINNKISADPRGKKTIFGTTEASNFILNMSENSLDKLIYVIFAAIIILLPIGNLTSWIFHELYEMPSMLFCIPGIAAMVGVLIVYQKRLFTKNVIPAAIILGLILILGIVSANFAHSLITAIKGYPGRGEGLLALFFYACLFLLGTRMSNSSAGRSYIRKFFDLLITVGVVQCFFGLLQIIPPIADALRSAYAHLDYSIFIYNVFLPAGLSPNPIIFAQYLAVLACIAMIGAVCDPLTKRRKLYAVAACAFIFFAVKTSSLTGIMGAVAAISVTFAFCPKAKNKSALKLSRASLFTAFAVLGMFTNLVLPKLYETQDSRGKIFNSFHFFDTGIIWEDSFWRISSTGLLNYDADDISRFGALDGYLYLWDKTFEIVADNPIIGTGEENIVFSQNPDSRYKDDQWLVSTRNTFDKPYNDYLYIAASRGIPALLLYIVFLVLAFKSALTIRKRWRKDGGEAEKWHKSACIAACVVYLIINFFSFSAVELAPIFFILLGLSNSADVNKNLSKV